MKRYFSVQTLLLLIILILAAPCVSFAGQFKVTAVYDGDTVKAEGHDIEIRVRLVAIDAPETPGKRGAPGQPYSQRAKEYLAKLVLSKTVEIKGYELNEKNLVLGVISLDGKNINLEMIRAGLAEVYHGLVPHKFDLIPYWQAEKEARDANRGVWSLGEKYVSPKDWRHSRRDSRR